MKSIQKIIFCLLFFFSIISTSFAATYYVSSSKGNDANLGTVDAPWAHCPEMAGWEGSAKLNAGDTIYFNSSDTWKLSSGSQGLWIKGGVKYIGDIWGNGKRAKFDVGKAYSQSRSAVLLEEDHPTLETLFKGFEVDVNMLECRGIMIDRGNIASITGHLDGATKRIENCYVHHIGNSSYNYGIHVCVSSNRTIKNVEIIDCEVHDTPRSAVCLYAGYEPENAHIYNVTISGCKIFRAGLNSSSGGAGILIKNHVENVVVEKNKVYENTTGVMVEKPYTSALPIKNVRIRYNEITSNGVGIYVQGGPSSNVYTYSNLIYTNKKYGIAFGSNLSGTLSHYISNNTFYKNQNNEIKIASSGAKFTSLSIKNNIFSSASTTCVSDDKNAITDHSNNLYYRELDSGTLLGISGKSYDLNSIKNWEPTAVTDKPGFENAAKGIFSLTEKSKAIKKGADLSYIFREGLNPESMWPSSVKTIEWNRDGWDIGAFVFGKYSPPQTVIIEEPKNLRVMSF